MAKKLKQLNEAEYQSLREGASVLEADGMGDKVLQLADGNILKLFRRKRLISSALYSPYAKRFAQNAIKLAQIGIAVPEVLLVMRISSIQRDAVLYKPLQGITLRQIAEQEVPEDKHRELRTKLSNLVVHLCRHGMYFRSLHTGNVIVMENGQLGLIDFSDMRFYPFPLGRYLCRRMTHRMMGVEAAWLDMDIILQAGSLDEPT